jgi:hypothetical protein
MRRLLAPLLLLAALTLSLGLAGLALFSSAHAAGATPPAVGVPGGLHPASGEVQSAPIEVGSFTRLQLDGNAEVELVQGDREAVVVAGPSRGQARVLVRASGGRLTISAPEDRKWWSMFGRDSGRPSITVYFRELDTLALAGSFELRAASLKGDALRINASGASSIGIDDLSLRSLRFSGAGAVEARFAGRVTEQDVSISGAGEYRAKELLSDSASVSVSGAGTAVVHAQKTLSATLSGVGEIAYYGNPEVKQRLSGLGRIERRSEAAPAPRDPTAARPRTPAGSFRA